jgi:DNA adenine methylase
MKYMGSKGRHAREILPLILRSRMDGQPYVEPFVGGFNVIDKVEGIRFGNDNHPYLISLFKAVQNGWEPPTSVSEQEYADGLAVPIVENGSEGLPEGMIIRVTLEITA